MSKVINTNLLTGWRAPPQQLGTDLGSMRLQRAYDVRDAIGMHHPIESVKIYEEADAAGEDRSQDPDQGMVVPDPTFDTPDGTPTESPPIQLPTSMFPEPIPPPPTLPPPTMETPFNPVVPLAPTETPAGVPIERVAEQLSRPPAYGVPQDEDGDLYDAPPGYQEALGAPPGYQEALTGGALYRGQVQHRFATVTDEHGNTLMQQSELARPEMQAGMVSGLNTQGAAQRGIVAGRQGFSRAALMTPRRSEWTKDFP